jgi:DNA primase
MDSKVVALPPSSDPADIIGRDAERWNKLVKESEHVVDFYLTFLQSAHTDERLLRAAIERQVIPYVARIKSSIARAQYVAKIARFLGIGEEPVLQEVRRASAQKKEFIMPVPEKLIPKVVMLRKEKIERNLLGIIFWQEQQNEDIIEVSNIKDAYRRIVGEDHYVGALALDATKKNEYIFEAERISRGRELLQKEVEELLLNLEISYLTEARERVALLLRNAERENNITQVDQLLKEYQRLTADMESLATFDK